MLKLTLAELAADRFVQTGVLAFFGTFCTQALLRRWPTQRLVFQLVFFVALTALLHHYDIVPYEPAPDGAPVFERVFEALAKITWWLNGAWVLTSLTRLFLIFERRPHESRLAQDLVVGAIHLGAVLSIVAYVFAAPLGTLIATSGVLAIILGLALQSTLSDVFSGVALNLSKGYAVGDWIVLSDGMEGRVVETNWRATHLLNASNDLVVLPNSSLAKAQLTNLSSPNRSHGVKLRIRLVPSMAPSALASVMRNVLLSSNAILTAPAPTVGIRSLDAEAIEFELAFRVADFDSADAARHEVYDLIYRHARANGLQLAPPREAGVIAASSVAGATPAAPPRNAALRLVETVPLFASLSDTEKATLAESMTRKTYAKGEVLVAEGTRLDALTLIRTGVVVVTRGAGAGEIERARLAPGDYFGDGEPGTVRALTFTVTYEISHATLAALLKDRPAMAEEIGVALAAHSGALHTPVANDADDETPAGATLLARVRRLLERPTARSL